MRLRFLLVALILGSGMLGMPAGQTIAAEGAKTPPDLDWSFEGPFGTYDRAAMQRGFKVYRNVCATCHALEHLHYRNLSDLGYSDAQIKAIAAEDTVRDGPNDQGKMFERPAKPSDAFARPYKNKAEAKYANNGAYPPDQSLIVDARAGGADYVYGILTGYDDPPEGEELRSGQYWNKYMPGHIIAMPPPLHDGIVKYEDGSPETVKQYARDVTHFLAWASEPKMEARKTMGIKVSLFLIVFAAVMYGVKKKLWARLEH